MYDSSISLISGRALSCGSVINNKSVVCKLLLFNNKHSFSSILSSKSKYDYYSQPILKKRYTGGNFEIKEPGSLLKNFSEKHLSTLNRYRSSCIRHYLSKFDCLKKHALRFKFVNTYLTLALATILLCLLNNKKLKVFSNNADSGSSNNIIVKYFTHAFNDPKLEESLKNLIKRILLGVIEELDDESLMSWKLFIKKVLKECENEIGNGLTNVLKRKIVQDWIYSTANEVMDYLSKTPEIVSKTSLLFSEAINHQIFTQDSKKWFDEFVKNYIVNNKEILNSFNQLLTNLFNTKETQANISGIIHQLVSNKNTKEYLNIAIWDAFKNYIVYPKHWFIGTNKRCETAKNEDGGQANG